MNRAVVEGLRGAVLLMFVAASAGAAELTVNSILAAHQSGAPAHGIIAMVNSHSNTVAMTAGDIVTLRNAGVPETVISAIWAQLPAPPPEPVPLRPDDARLVDVVRLIASGTSEQIIAEQVRQSGSAYNLSVNDLLYLRENGARESTIAALLATRPGAPAVSAVPPSDLVFDDLVLVKTGIFRFFKKDHDGRLVMQGETLRWIDNRNPERNFNFQVTGVEKVWYTCDARSSGNFCYQVNFKIVKGDTYRFRDLNRESGSNTAVTRVMEALRTYFPRLTFATPSVAD